MAKFGPAPEAQNKLTAFGLDSVCQMITDGVSMTTIAQEAGVSIGTLCTWVDKDPERSARVREARTVTARVWDEKATKCIEDAADEFDLKKARELAHHYRWRASKIAPKEYGDKLEIENKGMPLVIVKDLTGRANEPADD